jgi:hypothetical protein
LSGTSLEAIPETIFHVATTTNGFQHMKLIDNKGKVKSKVFFLTGHHAMKAYWVSGGIALRIL